MNRARAGLVLFLLALALSGCAVGAFIVGAPPPGARASARGLLARRCSGCHAIPDPATMTPAEWRAGLDRMRIRMTLPAAEWDTLAAMGVAAGR